MLCMDLLVDRGVGFDHADETMLQNLIGCNSLDGIKVKHFLKHVHKHGDVGHLCSSIVRICGGNLMHLEQ